MAGCDALGPRPGQDHIHQFGNQHDCDDECDDQQDHGDGDGFKRDCLAERD